MSVLVHLVRHASHAELGAVLSGRSEIGLGAAGHAQAEAVARRLGRAGLSALLSSPRRRAVETAAAIGAAAGLSVATDAGLDEIDFGLWTGRAFADLAHDPDWTRWNEARELALPPEGESMAEAADRMLACIRRVARVAGGPVALVGHADPIRGAIARVLGLPLGRLLAFDVDPASVSTLSVGEWGARVVAINGRSHLGEARA